MCCVVFVNVSPIFSCPADHVSDWQPPYITLSVNVKNTKKTHTPLISPIYVPIVIMEKERRMKSWFMVTPEKAAPVTGTTLGGLILRPCASVLSAVNAVGTQLGDL